MVQQTEWSPSMEEWCPTFTDHCWKQRKQRTATTNQLQRTQHNMEPTKASRTVPHYNMEVPRHLASWKQSKNREREKGVYYSWTAFGAETQHNRLQTQPRDLASWKQSKKRESKREYALKLPMDSIWSRNTTQQAPNAAQTNLLTGFAGKKQGHPMHWKGGCLGDSPNNLTSRHKQHIHKHPT